MAGGVGPHAFTFFLCLALPQLRCAEVGAVVGILVVDNLVSLVSLAHARSSVLGQDQLLLGGLPHRGVLALLVLASHLLGRHDCELVGLETARQKTVDQEGVLLDIEHDGAQALREGRGGAGGLAMVLDGGVADLQDEACGKRLRCLAVGDAVATRIRRLGDQGRHDLVQLLGNAPLLLRQGGGVGDARGCFLLRLARLAPLLAGLGVLLGDGLVAALLAHGRLRLALWCWCFFSLPAVSMALL